MAQTMSASMTDGQIETALNQLRDAMRKHRDEVTSSAAQETNGLTNLGMRLFAVYRELAEKYMDMIVHNVDVDTAVLPEQAIAAMARRQYVTAEVVRTMPKGMAGKSQLYVWKPDLSKRDGYISDDNLELEVPEGFIFASPYQVAKMNADDPSFADEHPNTTHWKDESGKWCYLAADRWRDEREVDVYRSDDDWDDRWSFVLVRK